MDLREGLLLRPSNAAGMVVDQPFTGDAANARLKLYLREMDIYQGETGHGFRAGCAITLGWEREHTAKYYMQLAKVLHTDVLANLMAEDAGVQIGEDNLSKASQIGRVYQDLNELNKFATAFPV